MLVIDQSSHLKIKTNFLQYYAMQHNYGNVFFYVTRLTEILETKIFTCSFQCLYITDTCALYCGINESIMLLWLAYLSLAS